MKTRASLYVLGLVFLLVLGLAVGCSKAPNDAQIGKDIQTKLGADSGLAGKQINVQAENGTVTLAGTVDNDTQRDAAARYASSEEGVKQVVNNLQVAPPAPVAPQETAQATPPPPPVEQPKPSKPRASRPRHTQSAASDNTPVNTTPAPAVATNTAPPAPVTPPPPPPPQKVTIPSGTTMA